MLRFELPGQALRKGQGDVLFTCASGARGARIRPPMARIDSDDEVSKLRRNHRLVLNDFWIVSRDQR